MLPPSMTQRGHHWREADRGGRTSAELLPKARESTTPQPPAARQLCRTERCRLRCQVAYTRGASDAQAASPTAHTSTPTRTETDLGVCRALNSDPCSESVPLGSPSRGTQGIHLDGVVQAAGSLMLHCR